ncbi:hypothetical protein FXE78_00915 [Vibrio mimicus]|nr:hypothetical protein FXE78_00915 [Vibrio mimicus]
MSGSSSTLLCHRPLRTVRASFPAYGSSLYKFILNINQQLTYSIRIFTTFTTVVRIFFGF